MLLESVSALLLSLPSVDKTESFVHVSSNLTLQLINGISSDIQKLFRYFIDTAIAKFSRISSV